MEEEEVEDKKVKKVVEDIKCILRWKWKKT